MDNIAQYLHLTKTIMPKLARDGQRKWPVVNDHCFQRIVLDTVCGGVWYDSIARPAYKNMTQAQARHAVMICENIIIGTVCLNKLNQQSLRYRGKVLSG